MAFFYEDDNGKCGLILMWSRDNMTSVRNAEREAQRMIEAAHELVGVSTMPPLGGWLGIGTKEEADRWWLEVFADTEEELQEQATALARLYRGLRFKPWRWLERRRVKHSYIKVDAMLTRGHGLSTEWR